MVGGGSQSLLHQGLETNTAMRSGAHFRWARLNPFFARGWCKTRGPKKFNTEQYLAFQSLHDQGDTWISDFEFEM